MSCDKPNCLIHMFGDETLDSNTAPSFIGKKGWGLHYMMSLGVKVPVGFVITNEVSRYYLENDKMPVNFIFDLKTYIKRIEKNTECNFGGAEPLLLAVRSGAVVSAPGVMDTILNVGMNDGVYNHLRKENPDFAYNCYRRFIIMFAHSVYGIDKSKFKEIVDISAMKSLVYKMTEESIPQNVYQQLLLVVEAVIKSSISKKAIEYQNLEGIENGLNTAIIVQKMVFGNCDEKSGSGVLFSRDPNSGEKKVFGEFIPTSQGEALVSGEETPRTLEYLKEKLPNVYNELLHYTAKLEKCFKDIVDIEFTVESGKLWFLQIRKAKKSTNAHLKIIMDFNSEGIMTPEQAVESIPGNIFEHLTHKSIKGDVNSVPYIPGLAVAPGCATGQLVFACEDVLKYKEQGLSCILVCKEASVDHVVGMYSAAGFISLKGGATSHCAIVARSIGIPVLSNLKNVSLEQDRLVINNQVINKGDEVTIDGTNGNLYLAKLALEDKFFSDILNRVLNLICRVGHIAVRTNSDNPNEVIRAMKFGAKGVGLCRTEHMFFEANKIKQIQQMLFTPKGLIKSEIVNQMVMDQSRDIERLMKAANGLPVNIRLLDAPLHEFMPRDPEIIKNLARGMGISIEAFMTKIDEMQESNPMLGKRGVRLGIIEPLVYDIQIRAIFNAMNTNNNYRTEIMIPLVSDVEEIRTVKKHIEEIAKTSPIKLNYSLGTMIETPRSALTADAIAKEVEFFSFGTNDLTQMSYGISRDDFNMVQGEYENKGIWFHDPFKKLDIEGVGELIKIAIVKGRKANPNLKIGLCGEQAVDVTSLKFIHSLEDMSAEVDSRIDYVSCVAHKVPSTILASAKIKLAGKKDCVSKVYST